MFLTFFFSTKATYVFIVQFSYITIIWCTNPLIYGRSCTHIPTNLRGNLIESKMPWKNPLDCSVFTYLIYFPMILSTLLLECFLYVSSLRLIMYVIYISDVNQEDATLKFVLCLTFGVKNKPFGISSQIDALSQNKGFLHQNFILHNVHAQF